MEVFDIQKGEESPRIYLNAGESEFLLAGKSYMEDAASFYEPVFAWLNSYKGKPNPVTKFVFEVEYINTASSKILLDILQILDEISASGKKVEIVWRYYEDDEDMEDLGEEMEELYDLAFSYQKMDSNSSDMFEVKTSF